MNNQLVKKFPKVNMAIVEQSYRMSGILKSEF